MSNGNFFNKVVQEIRSIPSENLPDAAISYGLQFLQATGMTNKAPKIQALLMGARFGTGGKSSLSEKESQFFIDVFDKILTGDVHLLQENVEQPISEADINMLKTFCNVGKTPVGMPLLYYILCFALCDGEMDEKHAQLTESIFGTVLLMNFFAGAPDDDDSDEIDNNDFEDEVNEISYQEETAVVNDKTETMDTTSSVISAVVAINPSASINIEKIRHDVDSIVRTQGSMSEAGIHKYAEQYVSSWTKDSGEQFWDANVDIIDWKTDYTLKSSDPIIQKEGKKTTETEIKPYNGETLLVNHDFTVKVPDSLICSTKKSEIGQGNVLAMMARNNAGYQKPEEATLYFELQDPYQMTNQGFLDLTNQQVINGVRKAIGLQFDAIVPNVQRSKTRPGDIIVSTYEPTFLPMKNGWIVGYSRCDRDDHLVALVGIANDVYLYTGKLWMATKPDNAEIEKMVVQVASTLGFPEKAENSIEAGSWFVPTYKLGKKAVVKDADIPVPDQMVSNFDLKTNVPKFNFVCIPDGFEDGLINYKMASIGIGMLELGKMDWRDQWDNKYNSKKAIGKVHRDLSNRGIKSITDVSIDNRLYTGYFFVQESQPGPDYYCAYQYVIIVQETILSGMVYFNVQRSKSEYEQIIREWLSHVAISEERKQRINQEIERKAREEEEKKRRKEQEAAAKKQREEEKKRREQQEREEQERLNTERKVHYESIRKSCEERKALYEESSAKQQETKINEVKAAYSIMNSALEKEIQNREEKLKAGGKGKKRLKLEIEGLKEYKDNLTSFHTESFRSNNIINATRKNVEDYKKEIDRYLDRRFPFSTSGKDAYRENPEEATKGIPEIPEATTIYRSIDADIKKEQKKIETIQAGSLPEEIQTSINTQISSKSRKIKRWIILVLLVLIGAAAYIVFFHIIPEKKYEAANKLYASGQYEEAKSAYEEISSYKNSGVKIQELEQIIADIQQQQYLESQYAEAVQNFESGNYSKALTIFTSLEDYMDSADYKAKAEVEVEKQKIEDNYQSAMRLFNSGSYEDAQKQFEELKDYKDSKDMVTKCVWQRAFDLLNAYKQGDPFSTYYDNIAESRRLFQTIRNAPGVQDILDAFQYKIISYEGINNRGKFSGYYYYDEYGNLTYDGSVFYEYDENGRLIKETGSYYEREYYYNEDGQLEKAVNEGATILYSYDYEGKLIEEDTTSSTGYGYTRYYYEGDYIISSYRKWTATSSLSSNKEVETIYEYDSRGNLIAKTVSGEASGKVYYEYYYDSQNNLIKETYTYGKTLETNYTYGWIFAPYSNENLIPTSD